MRTGSLIVAVLTALLCVSATPAAEAGAASVVRTDSGLVRGTVHDGVRSWQGLPYAAPPTGDLRWRSPRPVTPWSGVRAADTAGADCAQNQPGYGGTPSGDEDCLYVNVTAPPATHPRRPVLVWLHGGGFQTGSGSMYDPHRLVARGDVVVVTVNYRLGVFGYLGLPGLAGSGTFGLQDQQAAVRWVRRNIAAFGGDPGNVTLAGQSTGGMSVCAQLTSPAAAGLFQRAIIQSGSCLVDWPAELFYPGVDAGAQWSPVATVRAAGARLAAGLGCGPDALACLRGMSPDALLRQTQGTGPAAFVTPAYGTAVLPRDPALAVRTGRFQRMPVLSGGNRDEHRSFLYPLTVTADRYAAMLRTAFGSDAARVAAEYPITAYGSPVLAWAAVATDRIWACPTATGNRLLARHNPTFAYEFTDRGGPVWDPRYDWGAHHGAELPLLFDVAGLPATTQPALADRMIDIWAGFAATGRTPWSRFPYVQPLAAAASGVADHHCRFWSGVTW